MIIPHTTLVFEQSRKHSASFLFSSCVSFYQISETREIYNWCHTQFGPPYTASFFGFNNINEEVNEVGDLSNKKWSWYMTYPKKEFHINGLLNVLFYNKEDATMFQIVVMR